MGTPNRNRDRALSDPIVNVRAPRPSYHAAFVRHDAYVAPMVPIIRELGPGLQHTSLINAGMVSGNRGGNINSINSGGGGDMRIYDAENQQHKPGAQVQQIYDSNLSLHPRIIYDRDMDNLSDITGASIDGTDFLVEGAHRGAMLDVAAQSDTKSQMIAIFMLCSISLGVGVFVLPKILLTTGVATGILMIVVFAFFAGYTQYISIDCAVHYKSHSYEELASQSLGKLGEFLLAFFMAISLLTGNCSHIATVGQLLHDIIDWFYTGQYEKYEFAWGKNAILYAIMLSLTLPWLFQRNLSGLSSVGTVSVMVVLITSISLVCDCLTGILIHENWAQPGSSNAPIYGFDNLGKADFWQKGFWSTAPTFGFVFTGLLELFPVFNELQGRNPRRAKPAILISTIICATIYIIVGSVVVIRYGKSTDDNSLYNIPAENYWITFLCFALVIMITLLYPVINYPMVNAIEKILEFFNPCVIPTIEDGHGGHGGHGGGHGGGGRASITDAAIDDDLTQLLHDNAVQHRLKNEHNWFYAWILFRRRNIISILGVCIVILVDVGISNLPDLFGLTGSLGLSFVCYIFPCLIHLKTYWKSLRWYDWKFWTSSFLLVFFTFLMVYSTAVIIENVIDGK